MAYEDQRKKIVIIGGGIVGCSIAYYLTRDSDYNKRLDSITLVEAGTIAAGASGGASGLVASWATPKCVAPLSFKLHNELTDTCEGIEEWGYHPVHVFEEKRERPEGSELSIPVTPRSFNAIGTPHYSARVSPVYLTRFLANKAMKMGVKIREHAYATSINYIACKATRNNPISKEVASVTASLRNDPTKVQKEVIPATHVIVAAGSWTSRLLPQVKLLSHKTQSVLFNTPKKALFNPSQSSISELETRDFGALGFHIIPKASRSQKTEEAAVELDHSVYISGPDISDDDLPVCPTKIRRYDEDFTNLRKAVVSLYHVFDAGEVDHEYLYYRAQIKKHKKGEEVGPIVGPIPDTGGLFVATRLDEWDVQNAPAVGLLIAEMVIEGRARSADVSFLDPKHFIRAEE